MLRHPAAPPRYPVLYDPGTLTLATVAQVASIAGAGISAIGALSNSRANADAATYNSEIAARNSASVMEQAQQEAILQSRDAQRQIGAEQAAFGAGGAVSNDGSALSVLANSASNAEYSRQQILYRARIQAAGYADEAALDTARAGAAASQGPISAASTLIGGVARAFTMRAGPGSADNLGAPSGYSAGNFT
jgi:hypothetical protein